jgi:hypothetical protein
MSSGIHKYSHRLQALISSIASVSINTDMSCDTTATFAAILYAVKVVLFP